MQETNQILSSLGPNAVESERLSRLLQSAYQGRYDPLELEQALNRFKDSLSNPLNHPTPDIQTQQQIQNNRSYQLPGIYQKVNISDDDLIIVCLLSFILYIHIIYII